MATNPGRRLATVFFGLWLFVIFVSVVDGYLAYRNRHQMLIFERNPWGRALIEWNGGRVWYLLAAKLAGTVVASAVLLVIYRASPRLGVVVVSVLACLQLGLLLYLILA